jgi:hypothetical protein
MWANGTISVTVGGETVAEYKVPKNEEWHFDGVDFRKEDTEFIIALTNIRYSIAPSKATKRTGDIIKGSEA